MSLGIESCCTRKIKWSKLMLGHYLSEGVDVISLYRARMSSPQQLVITGIVLVYAIHCVI